MKIRVVKKKASSAHKEEIIEYTIPTVTTLKELLIAVTVQVYNEHYNKNEIKNLTKDIIEDQAKLGKVSFSKFYNDNKEELDHAIKVMILDFIDGLFRVWWNEEECTSLDEKLDIKDYDTFVFIRFVMLAGRLW
ncbi:hypothetical protein [Breznakia pachnodae]|uniref:Uncharacterized protein n=1 Tax=Breznakia pachnodae TaxID=265178 RepID=A0ABU0E1M5_9FIRM|nr:hypothetical protein [Breznakia pachnodae]MDQ0360621.1 hypothetical protein [Breznakia pachnodae]